MLEKTLLRTDNTLYYSLEPRLQAPSVFFNVTCRFSVCNIEKLREPGDEVS